MPCFVRVLFVFCFSFVVASPVSAQAKSELVLGDIKLQTNIMSNSTSFGYSVDAVYPHKNYTYSLGMSQLASDSAESDDFSINASLGFSFYASDSWSLIVGPGLSNLNPFIFYNVLFPITNRLTLNAGSRFVIDKGLDNKNIAHIGIRYDFGDKALITSFDRDGDGVNQSVDICKNTPLGYTVNYLGCADSEVVLNEIVFFDGNSSLRNLESELIYRNLAKLMEEDISLILHIVNLSYLTASSDITTLESQRINTISNILIKEYGLTKSRIQVDEVSNSSIFHWKNSKSLLLTR